MLDGRRRIDIRTGLRVRIVEKHNQRNGRLTEGTVDSILTSSSEHPHGIKVRLKEGPVGRVKEILDSSTFDSNGDAAIARDAPSSPQEQQSGMPPLSAINDSLDLEELLRHHETPFVEFKSSFRFDRKRFEMTGTKEGSREVEKSLAKAVASFMNARGGIILIGVADDANITGIEDDLLLMNKHNTDTFRLQLKNSLESFLNNKIFFEHLKLEFHNINGKQICALFITACSEPIFVKENGRQECYVRIDNESKPFQYDEFMEYWNRRQSKKQDPRTNIGSYI